MKLVLSVSYTCMFVLLSISTGLAHDKPPREQVMEKNWDACAASTTTIAMAGLGVFGTPGVQIVVAACSVVFAGDGMGRCQCMVRPVVVGSGGRQSRAVSVCTVTTEHLCGRWGIGSSCCWYAGHEWECHGGAGS
jgi:hypothetical protein